MTESEFKFRLSGCINFVFCVTTLHRQNLSGNMIKSLQLCPFVVCYPNCVCYCPIRILIFFVFTGNKWKRWITRCSGIENTISNQCSNAKSQSAWQQKTWWSRLGELLTSSDFSQWHLFSRASWVSLETEAPKENVYVYTILIIV